MARMVAGRHSEPKRKSRTVADGSTFIVELYLNCLVLSAFTPHKVLYIHNYILNNGNT